ncbi:YceI family protein [Aquicella lusitana]|uniref:Polyisoprenoid-binding protein YceI n=1 Tax=Aquicella lusitana TaxID=254246 RepID=A0A370GEJ8_9COXI|nr:YceI family protein [Aquicella lusitana]RDI42101.1 polyisoprenoid-binding protein YceI [Aquicella lusitana]VVC74392.1 Protein YceI [Aquicella lusitana]
MALILSRFFIYQCIIVLLLFMPVMAKAEVSEWQILSGESSITFSGIQNNAPISGKFKKFNGIIVFDPDQLSASKVRIVIDINSVSTSYSDLTSALLTSDWFNAKRFPEAVFEANHFTKTGENKYEAKGNMTIRDKTVPIKITFEGEPLSDNKWRAKGSTILKRLVFGIGQGEWESTDEVKNEVKVNFSITAIRK